MAQPSFLTRFIPACAGNALERAPAMFFFTVHPRVCGEREVMEQRVQMGHGSSPRVRGTLYLEQFSCSYERFIPACAGNADKALETIPAAAVHPRVCGERNAQVSGGVVACGSSPRVRGTHKQFVAWLKRNRFIPACAGNAPGSGTSGQPGTVHPRVCGERSSTQEFDNAKELTCQRA